MPCHTETIKINNWVNINKLTINYKKSYFMIVGKKNAAVSSFKLSINNNLIEETDNVKYLGVHLDNKLSWKIHIDVLTRTLSKVCEVIYKLRHYVPFSILKLVYYAMFHSHLQYSLINWGRAYKSHYHNLVILQNKILRASLFLPMHYPTNLLYTKFCVLKLDDMIKRNQLSLCSNLTTKCFQILSTTTSQGLIKYINIIQGKQNVMNILIFRKFISREESTLSYLPKIMERYSAGIQALFFL